jgi:colanic acid biosynthesis glycosyl transferase WcaI
LKILLYSINHAPELTGIGKYNGELTEWLTEQGHEVKVVTSFPYYPNWKIQKPYKGKWWKKEQRSERETVIRCPMYVPSHPSALKRILHEFSFLLSSTLVLLMSLFQKCDAVVCVVTPFHLGIPARLFSWLKGIPMVYHIQDLQVDAAADLNMIKNKSLLKLMKSQEKWILKNSDLISTISEGMIEKIKAKGILNKKVYLFPNWVDLDFIRPLPKSESLKEALGFLPSDRIVLYSGNLGEKQGLNMVIEVAHQLRTMEDLYFVIVGEGGVKEKLMKLAKHHQLKNVRFFPLQPYDKLGSLLAMADLHLVPQRKAASDLCLPSKLSTIFAAGGCALITADEGSTLHQIVHQYQLGILINSDNADSFKEGVLNALNGNGETYGQNARSYAERYLDKEKVLRSFEQQLFELMEYMTAASGASTQKSKEAGNFDTV